jgi:phosphate acetyltransferase
MGKETIENRTFAEIAVGDSAALVRTLSQQDISLFAASSGDLNPTHLDSEYMKKSGLGGVVGHSLWGGALISSLLGNVLPARARSIAARTFGFCNRSMSETRSPSRSK